MVKKETSKKQNPVLVAQGRKKKGVKLSVSSGHIIEDIYRQHSGQNQINKSITSSLSFFLGNNTDNVDIAVKEKVHRKKLYKIKKGLVKKSLGSDRVRNCMLRPIDSAGYVSVDFNQEHGSARVTGVQLCESVWACPVCREVILRRRSEMINNAQERWTKQFGGKTFMITLTVPHNKFDKLSELYGSSSDRTGLSGALRIIRQSRYMKDLRKETGYLGDIRSVETTYGKNGWHVHMHILVFCKSDLSVWDSKKKKNLYSLWIRACEKAGLGIPNEHGVSITDHSSKRADYLAKWGVGSELASTTKKAREGNLSIYEMEELILDDSVNWEIPVLREYYETMHGKKMMQSSGLTKGEMFGLIREGRDDIRRLQESVGVVIDEVKSSDELCTWLECLSLNLEDKIDEGDDDFVTGVVLVRANDWKKINDYIYIEELMTLVEQYCLNKNSLYLREFFRRHNIEEERYSISNFMGVR